MPRETPAALTRSERAAAKYIGYSVEFLRHRRRAGQGPVYIQIGRSIRYRVRDLDAWLDAHAVKPRTRAVGRETPAPAPEAA
jgi:hypothetical protein